MSTDADIAKVRETLAKAQHTAESPCPICDAMPALSRMAARIEELEGALREIFRAREAMLATQEKSDKAEAA